MAGLGKTKMYREAYGLGEERVQLEARLEGLLTRDREKEMREQQESREKEQLYELLPCF